MMGAIANTLQYALDQGGVAGIKAYKDTFLAREKKLWGQPTFLMHCHREGASLDVVRCALQLGDSPLDTLVYDNSALHDVSALGEMSLLRMYIEEQGCPVDHWVDGTSPLMSACVSRNPDAHTAVHYLLQKNASVNPQKPGYRGPLHILAASETPGSDQLVEPLVRAGARINQRLVNGQTPLSLALNEDGNTHFVAALLRHGAAFDELSGQQEVAMKRAVVQGDADLLKLLLEMGLDVASFRPENSDKTLLHMAFQTNKPETVLTLLEAGVDPQARDRGSKTAASYGKKAPQCLQILKSFLARQEANRALAEIGVSQARSAP